MTKSADRLAREQQARQILEGGRGWRHLTWKVTTYIVASLGGFALGVFVGQPFLAWARNPEAAVIVRGFHENSTCVIYLVQFDHVRSVNSASFYLRFPGTITDVSNGVPENIGVSDEDFLRELGGVFYAKDGRCGLVSPKPLDTTALTSSFTGNTFSAQINNLINKIPMAAVIMTTTESSIYPPPKMIFSGEYTFNSFGTSAARQIRLDDHGIMPYAPKQNF